MWVGGGLAGLNDGRGLPDGLPVDEVASELLGHSSTRVTEGIHAHVTQRLVDEAASALERGLSR